ncbi:hypothetical protein FACS1894206_03070 [Deltaproteobacteria bacterium]|nr:hypothetical protein FACS1894206_03070 [Deltaproteobacteria bacterium]
MPTLEEYMRITRKHGVFASFPIALTLLAVCAAPFLFTEAMAAGFWPWSPKRGVATKPMGVVPVGPARTMIIDGREVTIREGAQDNAGFAVPDAEGGYVWIPAPARDPNPGYAEARELKLKARELAAQLIEEMNPSLAGMVALPTSFVNQEDFSQSSPLGRFMAEQLFYEFNQRGFPVREYRMASGVVTKENGEFLLSRQVAPISTATKGTLFVAGTYFIDRQAVFINARLLRGDGIVLRTAQILLPGTAMTRRMSVGGGGGASLKKGTLPIQDYKTTTQPTNLTAYDLGADIH